MIPVSDHLIFAGAALLLVLTPGPNMIYLISRSICQGCKAGLISLLGVVCGFFVHMFAAAAGVTALFMAVPFAFEALKWAGAAYLLYLAWQSVKPGARNIFEPQTLPHDSSIKLVSMGFFTSLLNPKVAMFYLSIFPQFVRPEHGSIFGQSVALGLTQIAISFTVNASIVMSAAAIASWFAHNPTWLAVQRYVMAGVLGTLALRMATEKR
jgi:threonine/homoserine/homoserine lactone efflux protein